MENGATNDLGVPVRAPYVKTGNGVSGGQLLTTGTSPTIHGSTAQIASTAEAPAQTASTITTDAPAQPETPARPPTLMEQFHPSLDPGKVSMTFDEKTGRVRVVPIAEANAEGEAGTDEGLPELATPHTDIPGGSVATAAAAAEAPGGEVAGLRQQVSELTNVITLMAQSQMTGKPLAELLGLQASTPAQPAQPDFSDVDLYQPQNLAAFIQQTVQGAIHGAMAPHQQTIEGARRRQEYDAVAAQHGADPHFNTKIVQALTMVKENPGLTIEQGFNIVNRIASQFIPAAAATTPAPTPAQTVKPATRTITPQQAEAKAAQAAKLPAGNSGVRGAGAAAMPEHIKGLGQMIAWNLQQAHLQGR